MPKKQILFIINPISGSGKVVDWKSIIKLHLNTDLFDHKISYTGKQGDATRFSQDAAGAHYDVVCAVGGDGTINEVAQGLINTETAMAIIPRGSGNGLARHLGIPIDPKKAIKRLNEGKTHHMDTGLLNDKLFLCVAGMGFDATVAKAFDEFGKRGLLSYMYLSATHYFKYKPSNYTIHIDGQKIYTKAFLITFANASQFGNNAFIAPMANTNDGLMNLIIIKPFPLLASVRIIFQVFTKKIQQSRYCETHTFQSLHIESDNNVAHIDGEPTLCSGPTHVSIRPNSLKIVY